MVVQLGEKDLRQPSGNVTAGSSPPLVELGLKVHTLEEVKEADSHAVQAAKLAAELGLKVKVKGK